MKRGWDFRSMDHFEATPSGANASSSQQQQLNQVGGSARESGDNGEPAAATEQPPRFQQTAHYVHRLDRFSLSRHVTEFVLNANIEEPDEALREAFDSLIRQAIRNSEQQSGRRVLKIGITLQGRGLYDPIMLPPRPPEQNSADALMGELDKLGQSDGDAGEEGDGEWVDKRTLLLSEPVQICITCISPPTGAGPRFHPYQHWGYNEQFRIPIRNEGDNYCLFYALIAARAYHDRELFNEWHNAPPQQHRQFAQLSLMQDFCQDTEVFKRLLANHATLRSAVERLMHASDIPADLNAYGMDHLQAVQDYWDQRFPHLYRIVLFEDRPEELPKPIWKGPMGRRFDVTLFLSNGHYDGIKKINCFFKLGRKYCVDCECSYDRSVKHTMECKSRCPQCAKIGPDRPCQKENGVKIRCPSCNRFFFSRRCFNAHQGETCALLKRCNCCQRVYQLNPRQPHKCFSKYCRRCKVYHDNKSGCFIRKLRVPAEKQRYRIVCWDTETRLQPLVEGQQVHKVNYLSARVTCTECADSLHQGQQQCDDCEICKNQCGLVERTKDWSEADGEEPVEAFVEWILTAWSRKFKTYIWAHNASRFDGHFVLKYLGETRRRPDVVMNGLKIFEFRLQHSPVHSLLIWRDSCLLFPIRLEGLKSTFNLDCAEKPFFPYAFNRRENYTVRLPHLPDREDYCTGSMKQDKFEKFERWYTENRQTPFFLPDELRAYCRNDTEILLKSVLQFRHILMQEITNGFDVLPISCTIASACMNIFRAKFMKDNQLAIVPEAGYERNDRASVLAIKYLDWRAKSEGVQISHAGNGREKRIKNYKLDGWIEQQNKCIEVLGCFWHGCERCFDPNDKLVDGKTCRELNEATQDRLAQLREPDQHGRCIEVEEIWECEINSMLSDPRNTEMKAFFDDLGVERGPIEPRLAYCGGRTGPLKLFAESSEERKISVYDIVSLYPWVNYDTDYPIGIPKIVHPTAEQIVVDWSSPNDLLYRGIYRVRVIPPRGLCIPVLPVKLDERLLFCCCYRCAMKFQKIGTRQQHLCTHTDEQRSYTGNYTHIELERALQHGYKIDRFWRAWHYEHWSDQIFKEYVRLFLKLKIESSGFPDGIVTDEQKRIFAAEYMRIYHVQLNLESVKKNPGLRFIAKLMLNSLWGKFSMRNELGSNKVITRPQEFYKLVLDHKIELSAIVPLSDHAIRVTYKHKKHFAQEHSSSNIVLSLWTTSRARLKLLDYMMQIHNTEGAELLYTDTDSVIVKHRRNVVPIQTGEYLGQMSAEYAGYEIKTFICGGAKQYALQMTDQRNGQTKYVQKIRGITFDVRNSQALQFEHFKQKVLNFGARGQRPAVFSYDKIQPTRSSQIITRELHKRYLPVCQKGVISERLEVFPFGYQ